MDVDGAALRTRIVKRTAFNKVGIFVHYSQSTDGEACPRRGMGVDRYRPDMAKTIIIFIVIL